MTRSERDDDLDTWHHVMNRGIARRTLFENELDIRTFLARLACVVRSRRIEVHAYCVLTTHFHLLLRSPAGKLSEALHDIQNGYSRWFNRTRKRDGPLYRGRFRSKRVDTLTYRFQLVRYIDANPVFAGLVDAPAHYPHASARDYSEARGPIWLDRWWVEETVKCVTKAPVYLPAEYARLFGGVQPDGARRLVERRIELQGPAQDMLDDLIEAAPARVLDWMRRKSLLADGTDVGLPVCDPADVMAVVEAARAEGCGEVCAETTPQGDPWTAIQVGLLRDLCGVTVAEIAQRTASSASGASRSYARHQRCMSDDEHYALQAAGLAKRALDRSHGLQAGALSALRSASRR